jgi:hypothetical protein
MPPLLPNPFDGIPTMPSGKPITAGVGRLTSGGPRIVASMTRRGLSLRMWVVGGTNCFSARLGRSPLLAGVSSLPPPPPPPVFRKTGT